MESFILTQWAIVWDSSITATPSLRMTQKHNNPKDIFYSTQQAYFEIPRQARNDICKTKVSEQIVIYSLS